MRVIQGDCLEVLKGLEDESIDAVVTDPPAGISFMQAKWDKDKGGRDQWIAWLAEVLAEARRVLKPGGYALVWALPRTSHWTGMAIENAGFDIRDRVSHLNGQGFPKGGDVSKQIDKSLGVKRTVVGPNPNHRAVSGVSYEGTYAGGNTGAAQITAATSPEAKQWEGWASALKPACEDWWLARKPFEGPLYKNVLQHGTGALNVDATRIPTAEKLTRELGKTTESESGWKSVKRSPIAGKDGGRWPANVTFDEEAAAMLDEQSGVTTSGAMKRVVGAYDGESDTKFLRGDSGPHNQHGDSGGASRFFYVAKATKKEKNAGLPEGERNTHPTVKSIKLMRWLVRLITPPGGTVLDPFCGSGSTGVACAQEGFDFIGIDENPEYVKMARQRLANEGSE